MNIENPFVNYAHPLIDFVLQKLVDTPIYPEMKECVKIVQIKKLKMKVTFSLDVHNLVGREIYRI